MGGGPNIAYTDLIHNIKVAPATEYHIGSQS